MRIPFKVIAILECARFTLVNIYCHQSRRLLAAHDAPFASGRKARAAQAAEAGVFHFFQRGLDVAFATHEFEIGLVAASSLVFAVIDVFAGQATRLLFFYGEGNFFNRRTAKRILPHTNRRCRLASSDARHRQHTHILSQYRRQFFQQFIRTRHRARKRFTHAHGQRRWCRFAFLDHIEMVVEGRDFVDFGLRQFHRLGQRSHVRRRERAVFVLDEMQILDQQIAANCVAGEQRRNIGARLQINLTAFGCRFCFRVGLHFAAHFRQGNGYCDAVIHRSNLQKTQRRITVGHLPSSCDDV